MSSFPGCLRLEPSSFFDPSGLLGLTGAAFASLACTVACPFAAGCRDPLLRDDVGVVALAFAGSSLPELIPALEPPRPFVGVCG